MKINCSILVTCLIAFLTITHTQGQLPWHLSESGTILNLNGVDFISPDTGVIVGEQGLILKTTDGGASWETIDAGIATTLNAVQYISETRVIAVGNSGILLKSENGGEAWDEVPIGGSITLSGISVDKISGLGLISGATLAMIWTDDFGETWTLGMGGYMSNFNKAHMTEGDVGIAFGENSIFQPLLGFTDDAGGTFDMWNFYPNIGGTNNEGVAVDGYFFSKNEGFVVGRVWDGTGFLTQEIDWSTHSWNATQYNTPLQAIDFDGPEHGVMVGGTATTWILLETDDGGITWDAPVVNGNGKGFNEAVLIGNTGYAVGRGGQIVKKQVPVGSEIQQNEPVGMNFYPNPAEGETKMIIKLDKSETLNLAIYDVSGKVFKQQFLGEMIHGRHSIQVELTGLPQGIYMCVLNYAGGVATKKLLVQ